VQAWRGFIAKFNPVTSAGGVSLAYATYLGGQTANTSDYISGIAIDSASNAYVVGYTNSKDFPVTSGAYGTVCGPNGGTCAAAHVTKLNPTGTAILWSTYVGGAKSDGSDALYFTGPIQLDGKGNIYIMGQAGPTFPWSIPWSRPWPAGPCRWPSPSLTPRARTCCSPRASDPAGSKPRIQPGWQSTPPATSISPAIPSARA
jgi:hypothetical protein